MFDITWLRKLIALTYHADLSIGLRVRSSPIKHQGLADLNHQFVYLQWSSTLYWHHVQSCDTQGCFFLSHRYR